MTKSPQSVIAAAVVVMQLSPDMPTVYCRHTVHGPLSKLDVDAFGAPLLVCATCGSVAPLTEDQIRLALGAAALPASPVTAEFGTPAPAAADVTALRRAPVRVETAFGAIRASVVFAVVVAAVVALTLTPRLGAGWASIAAAAVAFALDAAFVRLFRRRNQGRAAWLPGQDLRVFDLQPGTWIETPLSVRAASPDTAAYSPTHAARVHSITGLPDSPQTGYLELALGDGRVYTVSGWAPVRTLHVETLEARRNL